MAGDILLYQTDLVPIGDDQRQHLELARDVAERFNFRYGETFRVPDGVFPEVGGADHGPAGADEQDVDDAATEQGARLRSTTARRDPQEVQVGGHGLRARGAHDPQEKPGVSNLLEIMSVATGEPIDALERRFDGAGYGDFKEAVGESVVALLDADPRALRGAARGRAGAAAAARASARRRRGARPSRRSSRCTSAWASCSPRRAGSSARRGPAACRLDTRRPPSRNRCVTASPPNPCGGDEACCGSTVGNVTRGQGEFDEKESARSGLCGRRGSRRLRRRAGRTGASQGRPRPRFGEARASSEQKRRWRSST